MKLFQLNDLPESDKLTNGAGLFSLSFLSPYVPYDTENFSVEKFPVNQRYYLEENDLKRIRNINYTLHSEEIEKIEGDESETKKQYAIFLLETIFNNLNEEDQKKYLEQLKSSSYVKLSNPSEESDLGHTKINSYIVISSDNVITHFYNNVL